MNLLILATVLVWPMISEVKVNKYVYDNYTEPVTLFADPPAGAKLVYTTRPVWADEFGLKDWLDGMKWWSIYELEESDNQ